MKMPDPPQPAAAGRISLRALQAHEAAATATLIRDSFAALPVALDPPPSALRESEAGIAAILQAGGGFAAEDETGLMAVLLWQERDGGLYLGRLAVRPDRRRRGLAAALVAAGIAEAKGRNLPRVWLATRLALRGNLRLFEACGFRQTTLHAHDGHTEQTYVDMERTP